MHISASKFISLSADSYYRDKPSEYIIDDKLFSPISFGIDSLKKMYGSDGLAGPITKKEFAKGIGVSTPTLYLWINKGQGTIKISKLIDICNTFGVNMGSFITDENIPLPLNDVIVPKAGKFPKKQFDEIVELREIVSHSQKEIAKLKQEKRSLELSIKGNMVSDEQLSYQSQKTSVRNWTFNKDLLDNLPNMLHTSRDDLFKNVGLTNPSASYYDGNITVKTLIDICNKHQISSKHFIIRQPEQAFEIRELSFYQSKPFKGIAFHPEYIADLFGKNSLTGQTLPEILDVIGYSEMKIRSWRNIEKSSFRINDLIEVCDALSVTPSCFITDDNRTATLYSCTSAEFFMEESRLLLQENIRLREEIKRLKKK